MTFRYSNPNPFNYYEARFFIGLRVQFVDDSRRAVPDPISFEFEEAVFKAGQVLTVLAIHDYGQGCLLALSDGNGLVMPLDRDDFFLYFSPADVSPSRAEG